MKISDSFKKFFKGSPDDEDDEEFTTEETTTRTPASVKVPVSPKHEFLLVKPERNEDIPDIADSLMRGKTIILNLELVSQDTRRFVDFFCGVTYALGGQVKKVAGHTFLVIPGGVEISGDIFDEFEQGIEY